MVIQSFEETDFLTTERQISEGQNLLRACLFNLIVVVHDPARVAHCENLVRIITAKYPCKIIFVRQDPLTQADFSRVGQGVQMAGTAGIRVLCDLITIDVSASQFHKIPFLILPHIVPDLPLYVLEGQDPSHQTELLQQLEKHTQRFIFENDTIDTYSQFARQLLALMKTKRAEFIDLNWSRTKAWREVLARVFYNAELLRQAARSKMIQISYVEPPEHQIVNCEAQAIYVQAWLASKLGWTFVSIEKEEAYIRVSYKTDHIPIAVSLVPKDTEILSPGSIFSFEVMTHDDSHFLIAHENDSKLVKVHGSNPERCEIPYTIFLANYQNGPALVNEILYQPLERHYIETLQFLAHETK